MWNKNYKIDSTQRTGRPRVHPRSSYEILGDQRTPSGLRYTEPGVNRPLLGGKDIYIDGEWHFNTNPKKFYLLGYAFNKRHFGFLYNQNDYEYNGKILAKPSCKGVDRLNRYWLVKLLDGVKNIYFYGPDAGMLESMYHLKLKDKYNCVNLLSVVKNCVPKEDLWKATQELMRKEIIERKYSKTTPCYRLCCLEHLLGIKRSTIEYKKDVDNLHRDWYTPHLRAKALLYNKEDVINLIKVKEMLYKKYHITKKQEQESILQVTKSDKCKFKTR